MRRLGERADAAYASVLGAFFLTGIATVLLGSALPELRSELGLTQKQASWLFVAQFTTSSIGAVASGFSLRRSLAAGYVLVGVGLLVLATAGGSQSILTLLPGFHVAIGAMALVGLGLGLAIAASNLYVAHRHPNRRGGPLARLNVIWGLGALCSPLLMAGTRGVLSLEATVGSVSLAAFLAGFFLWRSVRDLPGAMAPATTPEEPRGVEKVASERFAFLALVAAILFFYVGTENAIGGWLVTLSDQLGGDRSMSSLWIGSGFWGAILLGRGITPWTLGVLSEAHLYRLSLVMALIGTAMLLVSESRIFLAAGAAIAGLGMAPLFPLTVSLLAAATETSRSRRAGWVLACGGPGGALLPWLTGRLGNDGVGAEAVQPGFLVPLLGLIAIAVLHGVSRPLGQLSWSDSGH